MMVEYELLSAILDSLKAPVLVADPDHVVLYMNRAAAAYYQEGYSLMGSSLLDCHNAQSQAMMIEILGEMQKGLEERLITDNEKHRIFMRAVRDGDGRLLGYYERYELPRTGDAEA